MHSHLVVPVDVVPGACAIGKTARITPREVEPCHVPEYITVFDLEVGILDGKLEPGS